MNTLGAKMKMLGRKTHGNNDGCLSCEEMCSSTKIHKRIHRRMKKRHRAKEKQAWKRTI